nr:retrovirus-related Pol polyprotein from transposon TNT 1-94 [Tanacetum cinerariifolium]
QNGSGGRDNSPRVLSCSCRLGSGGGVWFYRVLAPNQLEDKVAGFKRVLLKNLALRLVDGVDIGNNGGVPDGCSERWRDDAIAFISATSALGLRGRIRGDKNPGGRRDVGASSSAGTKSPGCLDSGTTTSTWSLEGKAAQSLLFSWIFFLAKKDETCGILKDFITGIENQLNHKVKIVRYDNGTEFKNYEMNWFCRIKGIKREFSNARTLQQNRVAERKNRTLIEASRTMLADSLLPIPFWAEVVNTACYVQNMVLVTKPHNKTPYELLISRAPIISFMRPFGCLVTVLNTLDHLGKFDGKADEGFLVGYSIHSKAFRVYNSRTKKVEEDLHVNFFKNKPNVAGSGLKIHSDVGQEGKEKVSDQEYILLPVLDISSYVPSSNEEVESSPKDDAGKKLIIEPTCVERGKIDDLGCLDQQMKSTDDSENTNINANGFSFSHLAALDDFSKMPNLEDTGIFDDAFDDREEGAKANYNNLEIVISVSP